MSTALQKLTTTLAQKLDMGDGVGLIDTLKATAFKGQVSDAQMTALLVVANQYGLNPWTKEIYAFPDKNNGIVPVVGVDGWARIINSHPQFDGMDFERDAESCTCTIYRKDRNHPIKVTEYLDECKRGTVPWQSHPKRMLRHKAMIQCSRLAFGYSGIYDQDEAERIVESSEKDMGQAQQATRATPELPNYSKDDFEKNLPVWRDVIAAGKATADQIIARASTRGVLNEEQKKAVRAPIKQESEAAESRVEDAEFKAAHEGAEQ
ncbi:MAG: phage recombination protein Bet [Pusillimonas sp.]|nr:phage recombination protein Bet [Pusillimonas sp.]MBC43594.1 phage recombination protein Bet [Pusillimonas sp.]HCP79405.1 phage recombination protein Bet [Pusillimonas sp.]|tara:strand:- start:7961 stop:8752 length:792 start_codon:yes stop_codon:yes gene_type:complete